MIVTGFLLILFLEYESSTTLFLHKHIIDGQLVTHSHLYTNTSETGKHTHTSYEFITIVTLSALLITTVLFDLILRLFSLRSLKGTDLENTPPFIQVLSTLSLRGPPII